MAMSAAQYDAEMRRISEAAVAAGAQDARLPKSWSSTLPGHSIATAAAIDRGDLDSSGMVSKKASVSDSGALSASSPLQAFIDTALDISARNNAHSAQQAASLRAWQEEQTRLQQQFNSAEAAKNRDWQQMMSSTAHQREVADLRAAGLNPILSASGGNGAAVTSGATASASSLSGAMGQTDTSANQAITGLLTAFLSAQTQLEAQRVSAQANLAVADKYNAMSKYTSELQAQTQLTTANIDDAARRYVAQMQAETGRYTADISAAASKVAASIHAAAAKYGYDVSAMSAQQIAAFNAQVNREMQQAGFKHEFDIKTAFPNNAYNAIGSVIESVGGLDSIGDFFTGIGSSAKDAWNRLTKSWSSSRNLVSGGRNKR